MGQQESKNESLAIAGGTSAFTTGAGIAIMTMGGPAGIVAGGIIVSAGISGSVSTVTQALN
jgi:hypothetical protein